MLHEPSTPGPTIFANDSDEQVLAWRSHAETMSAVPGRWQEAWKIFAVQASAECTRRHLEQLC